MRIRFGLGTCGGQKVKSPGKEELGEVLLRSPNGFKT